MFSFSQFQAWFLNKDFVDEKAKSVDFSTWAICHLKKVLFWEKLKNILLK